MTEENISSREVRRQYHSEKAQVRQERWMAKQAAREARQAARAARPRHNWTFEVRAGEKTYTFTWRWQDGLHSEVRGGESPQSEAAQEAAPEAAASQPQADL